MATKTGIVAMIKALMIVTVIKATVASYAVRAGSF